MRTKTRVVRQRGRETGGFQKQEVKPIGVNDGLEMK